VVAAGFLDFGAARLPARSDDDDDDFFRLGPAEVFLALVDFALSEVLALAVFLPLFFKR
jgi:hypothetical protein